MKKSDLILCDLNLRRDTEYSEINCQEVYETLVDATEELFDKYRIARIESLRLSRELILD